MADAQVTGLSVFSVVLSARGLGPYLTAVNVHYLFPYVLLVYDWNVGHSPYPALAHNPREVGRIFLVLLGLYWLRVLCDHLIEDLVFYAGEGGLVRIKMQHAVGRQLRAVEFRALNSVREGRSRGVAGLYVYGLASLLAHARHAHIGELRGGERLLRNTLCRLTFTFSAVAHFVKMVHDGRLEGRLLTNDDVQVGRGLGIE